VHSTLQAAQGAPLTDMPLQDHQVTTTSTKTQITQQTDEHYYTFTKSFGLIVSKLFSCQPISHNADGREVGNS